MQREPQPPATSPLSLFSHITEMFSPVSTFHRGGYSRWLTHAGARGLNPKGAFSLGLLQREHACATFTLY